MIRVTLVIFSSYVYVPRYATLLRMSNETRQYNGPALVQWIDNECKALGYDSLHDFGTKNGIPPKNFTDWKGGAVLGLGKLQHVAEALRRPLVDLLLAAEVLSPDDIGGRELTRTPLMTPEQAISASSLLSPGDKASLIQIYRSLAMSEGPVEIESDEPKPPRKPKSRRLAKANERETRQ